MNANKTARQNAAIEKRAKFVFNESGDCMIALALTVEERFQLPGHDLIQHACFGLPPSVLEPDILHRPNEAAFMPKRVCVIAAA